MKSKTVFHIQKDIDGKEDISVNKFLYVPSTLGAPMNVQSMYAFWKGEAKIVKIRFAEEGIQVIEMEKDPRFANNPLNNTPVLTVPVSYHAYRCKLDNEDRCTNVEEENKDPSLEWHNKTHFIPKFDKLKENEINRLHLANFDKCITETGIRVISSEMSTTVLNIEVEKTFKVATSDECLYPLIKTKTLNMGSFKMRFFYSLIDLNTLESKNYEPIVYPEEDHDIYGFFKTTKRVLNDVYDPNRETIVHYLDRWNPKKKRLNII